MSPEPEAITDADPAEIVRAIADDYLFRDVLESENVKSVALLRALPEAVALQLGNEAPPTNCTFAPTWTLSWPRRPLPH